MWLFFICQVMCALKRQTSLSPIAPENSNENSIFIKTIFNSRHNRIEVMFPRDTIPLNVFLQVHYNFHFYDILFVVWSDTILYKHELLNGNYSVCVIDSCQSWDIWGLDNQIADQIHIRYQWWHWASHTYKVIICMNNLDLSSSLHTAFTLEPLTKGYECHLTFNG